MRHGNLSYHNVIMVRLSFTLRYDVIIIELRYGWRRTMIVIDFTTIELRLSYNISHA